MTALHNYLRKPNTFAVLVSTVAIVIFFIGACLIGFRYETKKFKALLTTLTLVFIYQIFIGDVILMFLNAIHSAIHLRPPWTGAINPNFIGGPNRKKFLERRIAALKSQLELGPTFYKRNEAKTQKYKVILDDLVLYGGFLAILLVLIVGTRDPLLYYNSRTIKDVLRNPKFSQSALTNIITSDDLYNFINGTILKGFNDGNSYNGQPFSENGWMDLQIAKVLGVIRLRQIRHKRLSEMSDFDTTVHGPGWKKLPTVAYKEKFWRIFQPWEYLNDKQTEGVDRKGKLYDQPGGGYVALLGRNLANSQRVLDFLHKNAWIDSFTAVVVIEFTLYNVDADMFTLVTIYAEQTAFNSFVMTDRIATLNLLVNIDNLPTYALLTFLLYFLILTRVVADVVLKMWYSPSAKEYLSTSWNYVDMTIVGLNISIAFGVWLREVYVKTLLLQLETSKKNKYVSFSRAALIDETCTVLIAFLVALATLRLWKILQFARVFRLLTSTLHQAKRPLASTTFFIVIFLTGIGLGSNIINGNNSSCFADFFKSLTSLMSLSFGFVATATPSELNHGGNVVGFILYTMLIIVVTIFLLNMFITVLCLYFSKEKEEDLERSENEDHYTFWHFLVSEVKENWQLNIFQKKRTIESKDDDVLRLRGGGSRFGKPKEVNANGSEHMKRMELISELLDTQMELLRESMGTEQNEGDEDEISVERDKESCGETERPQTSKNQENSFKMTRLNVAEVQPKSSTTLVRSV